MKPLLRRGLLTASTMSVARPRGRAGSFTPLSIAPNLSRQRLWLDQSLLAPVPHRQVVLTLPKQLAAPVCVGNGSFVYDALYDNPPECRSPAPTRLVSIRQTPTSERVKSSRVRQDGRQTPAAGDTNSRKWLQVAGIQVVPVVPLDQESPGSSPGEATESAIGAWLRSRFFVFGSRGQLGGQFLPFQPPFVSA